MSDSSADSVNPHVVLGGDLSCARLLILLLNEVQRLSPGELVHPETSDPVAPIDLPAWCRLTGHLYLGRVPGTLPAPRYALRAAPSPRPTDDHFPWRTA